LGEAYYAQKDYLNALKNYQTSYALDKSNANAKAMIKRIQSLNETPQ
jgi:cytochrome c-type biogenesis protein CcmH/NrfG